MALPSPVSVSLNGDPSRFSMEISESNPSPKVYWYPDTLRSTTTPVKARA